MPECIKKDMLSVAFGQDTQWYDIDTLNRDKLQMMPVQCRGINGYFSADLTRYRYCTKEDLYRIGQNGEGFPLALYNGCLFGLRVHIDETHKLVPNMYELTVNKKRVYLLHKNEIDAIYAGCFDVRYKQKWYRCDMIGGSSEHAVLVVVSDPDSSTGLSSPHNRYMWGNGVEIMHDQIENVRLNISDSVVSQF